MGLADNRSHPAADGCVVDREERIRQVLPMLEEMIPEGLVTLEDIEILAYRANDRNADAGDD